MLLVLLVLLVHAAGVLLCPHATSLLPCALPPQPSWDTHLILRPFVGQPNSSPILPSGLIQTSACPFCFSLQCRWFRHKPRVASSPDFPFPVILAYQEAYQEGHCSFLWAWFFSLLKRYDDPSQYPTGRGALWSIFSLMSRGHIYRRLLLAFFLGFKHFFPQSFPRSISHIKKNIKRRLILAMDNCAINKRISQAVMYLIFS